MLECENLENDGLNWVGRSQPAVDKGDEKLLFSSIADVILNEVVTEKGLALTEQAIYILEGDDYETIIRREEITNVLDIFLFESDMMRLESSEEDLYFKTTLLPRDSFLESFNDVLPIEPTMVDPNDVDQVADIPEELHGILFENVEVAQKAETDFEKMERLRRERLAAEAEENQTSTTTTAAQPEAEQPETLLKESTEEQESDPVTANDDIQTAVKNNQSLSQELPVDKQINDDQTVSLPEHSSEAVVEAAEQTTTEEQPIEQDNNEVGQLKQTEEQPSEQERIEKEAVEEAEKRKTEEAEEAEQKRLQETEKQREEQAVEQERIEKEAAEEAEKRKTEEAEEAEQKREEQAVEQERIEKEAAEEAEKRKTEEAEEAEQKREEQAAEQERIEKEAAEEAEKRKTEEAEEAEKQREEQAAEQERIEKEAAEEAEKRKTEEAEQAEQKRLQEAEKQREEEEQRLAEEASERERKQQQAEEEKRLEEESAAREEAERLEQQRQAEEARVEEEKRNREAAERAARLAEEQKIRDEARRKQEQEMERQRQLQEAEQQKEMDRLAAIAAKDAEAAIQQQLDSTECDEIVIRSTIVLEWDRGISLIRRECSATRKRPPGMDKNSLLQRLEDKRATATTDEATRLDLVISVVNGGSNDVALSPDTNTSLLLLDGAFGWLSGSSHDVDDISFSATSWLEKLYSEIYPTPEPQTSKKVRLSETPNIINASELTTEPDPVIQKRLSLYRKRKKEKELSAT